MSIPITPRDLFREFTAQETDTRDAGRLGAQGAYATAVDLVDGMTKGATMNQWADIYTRLHAAAKNNRDLHVIMNRLDDEAMTWNEIMDTLSIAIDSLSI